MDSGYLCACSLIGLDRAAAKTAFAEFLQGSTFNANRIDLLETVINYLTEQGAMDPALLSESPYADINPMDVEEGKTISVWRIHSPFFILQIRSRDRCRWIICSVTGSPEWTSDGGQDDWSTGNCKPFIPRF